MTKWVLGTRDSAGYKVFNVRTHISMTDGNMDVDNLHLDAKNKTIVEMVMPDMWNDVIDALRSQPNVQVLEATPTGFPHYMFMDNIIKENSVMTFQGNAGQPGQYIKYAITSAGTTTTMEVTQTVQYKPGKVVAVETITVPGGSFVCSKWQYAMDNTQEFKQNGNFLTSKSFHEDITLWTAHGVGVVKSVNVTETGESTTQLIKIE
ncbi:hypothetical protein MKQ70_07775 [Chitinophaga sedimenti]|uniref:TapB family protein n=1 Tax=Chitinophaga sedimenti TaxID=2033606 RepID=UPI002006BE4E|nr:hypothetical protein [Chitinophaga sedimenti]MCK7554908.1 hypothetical protein [Chitinophaga sedimenti]